MHKTIIIITDIGCIELVNSQTKSEHSMLNSLYGIMLEVKTQKNNNNNSIFERTHP